MVSRVQGPCFRASSTGYMVSKVRGTWFREYEVHSFKGTGIRGRYFVTTFTKRVTGLVNNDNRTYSNSYSYTLTNLSLHWTSSVFY